MDVCSFFVPAVRSSVRAQFIFLLLGAGDELETSSSSKIDPRWSCLEAITPWVPDQINGHRPVSNPSGQGTGKLYQEEPDFACSPSTVPNDAFEHLIPFETFW